MKVSIHKAENRGHASYGWLNTWYSFSFANYYNPNHIHFGCLRVLNDDWIAGGGGFDFHPHENMEIITIMLDGKLEHQDSMGNIGIIVKDEVQVMTAGSGIYHAERNATKDQVAQLFQIWIYPRVQGLKPSYNQRRFEPQLRKNQWQYIVSPDNEDTLTIEQNAWLARTTLSKDTKLDYKLHQSDNGVFLMVVEGELSIKEIVLSKRDAVYITEGELIMLTARENTEVLLIEVPMKLQQ